MTTTPDQPTEEERPPARSQHLADQPGADTPEAQLLAQQAADAAQQGEQTQSGTTDEQPTEVGEQQPGA